MLRSIRSFAGSWIAKILFFLLIASFGVWGIGDMVGRIGPGDELGTVGGVEVTRESVETEFRRMIDRLSPLMGGELSTERAVQLGLVDQAVQTVVQRELLALAASDVGVLVGDDLIRARIAEEKAFQDQFGRFDPMVFRGVLRQNNLTEGAFVGMLRGDMARQLLTGTVTGAASVAAPDELVKAIFSRRGERRVSGVATLSNDSVGEIATPTEDDLKAYHQAHPITFTAPEYRKLTVVQLLLDDLAKDVRVSAEDVTAAYDERKAEFETPERRDISLAVFDDEAKAKAFVEAARKDGMRAAATAAGVDVVDLPGVTAGDLMEFGAVAFATDKGAIADPVKTSLGWNVVTVDAVSPGAIKPLEAVADDLRRSIARERAADGVFEISNQLDDKLAGGGSLEEAANALALRLITIPAVDATGKDMTGGDAMTAVGGGAKVVAEAFQLAPGATSRLVEAADGDFFAVRVDQVTPPALRPFDTVKAEVEKAWAAERRAEKAAEIAAKLAETMTAGSEDGDQAAAEAVGATFAVTEPFTRDKAATTGLPPDVVMGLFDAAKGGVVTGDTGSAWIVARLRDILPADAAAQAADFGKVQADVQRGVETDLLAQYFAALEQRHPVVLHHDRINRLFAAN